MTEGQLTAAVMRWAKALELDGWRIEVQVAEIEDLPDAYAKVTWVLTQRRATIRFRKDAIRRWDIDVTIVHELLHLHLAPVEHELRQKTEDYEESLTGVSVEQAIHHISESIVRLASGGRKVKRSKTQPTTVGKETN